MVEVGDTNSTLLLLLLLHKGIILSRFSVC